MVVRISDLYRIVLFMRITLTPVYEKREPWLPFFVKWQMDSLWAKRIIFVTSIPDGSAFAWSRIPSR